MKAITRRLLGTADKLEEETRLARHRLEIDNDQRDRLFAVAAAMREAAATLGPKENA